MAKILIVEDDVDLASRLHTWLQAERHMAEVTHDGISALEHLSAFSYDVIVLDWELPGLNGPEVCKQFRAKGGLTPIIMLTGRDQLSDKERGFDSGVDDYLTKPFAVKELSARIRALMRRPPAAQDAMISVGPLQLDPAGHKVHKEGQEIELLPKEFSLLEFFMRHPGTLFSPEALLMRVWNSEPDSTPDTVYTYVKRLRTKIDSDKKNSMIKTVYGMGYRFEP